MKPITVPKNKEELLAVGKELDAAHYFSSASEDPAEVARANARAIECERALDAADVTLDEDDNLVPKGPGC